MKLKERIFGFILLFVFLIVGLQILPSNMMYFRLIIGLTFGYVLSRSYTGFAGSVNRAYRTGSTKLMRTLMFMFVITSIATAAFLVFAEDITSYGLWINPINLGLIVGGVLFGIGMALSSCCASGVMTDIVTDLPRAGVTLIFFGIGVFVGFPLQSTQSWVTTSLFTSETGKKFSQGVFLPDWFKWDGLNGYLGAIVLTMIFAGIVVYLSYRYEQSRINKGTYVGVPSERVQDRKETLDVKTFSLSNESTINHVLTKPWTLQQGAFMLTILFVILMAVTKSGWGASTPYGIWVGKLLTVFGVSADSLASFTHQAPETFTASLLQNGVTVQNIGIMLGTLVFLLTSGQFKETVKSIPKLTMNGLAFYSLGGLLMGFGTRLSNGCNVGALYSPIAQFSLSGWIFLIALVAGGILGNKLAKAVNLD
ncbi:YeeE/YedE family protein [Vagococcus elongatus]|uniref:Uncharacterized protein n=1 Tax=Vagococcus elongatus TaxID=180344 RepID=A0A430B598_9ENTE|nr:YeeE/YedE family protein [Vagococcus elongatus]RSU15536.1 hypothetical protein CBF29_00210 [Vagococcus elongatus]